MESATVAVEPTSSSAWQQQQAAHEMQAAHVVVEELSELQKQKFVYLFYQFYGMILYKVFW